MNKYPFSLVFLGLILASPGFSLEKMADKDEKFDNFIRAKLTGEVRFFMPVVGSKDTPSEFSYDLDYDIDPIFLFGVEIEGKISFLRFSVLYETSRGLNINSKQTDTSDQVLSSVGVSREISDLLRLIANIFDNFELGFQYSYFNYGTLTVFDKGTKAKIGTARFATEFIQINANYVFDTKLNFLGSDSRPFVGLRYQRFAYPRFYYRKETLDGTVSFRTSNLSDAPINQFMVGVGLKSLYLDQTKDLIKLYLDGGIYAGMASSKINWSSGETGNFFGMIVDTEVNIGITGSFINTMDFNFGYLLVYNFNIVGYVQTKSGSGKTSPTGTADPKKVISAEPSGVLFMGGRIEIYANYKF